nr:hypothetical protein [uncultured Hyphomonas sp.]
MILHGNARGGGRNLALHLMRTDENEHVDVHEVSGFMAEDVLGAFNEVEALAKGTRCEKPLFSLSLSPPKNANVTAKEFEDAISKAEEALGLRGQPRVIVFHEKGDHRDRHCHVVWSRIDGQALRAIPMPFNRLKMRDVSRALFIEHGWNVPKGLIDKEERNPLNFTFEQYQHAKRVGRDAKQIKADIQNAWAASDSRSAFEHALKEKGFRMAQGARRGFVVTDHLGEVYSLPKWLGVKTKDVRAKLGPEKDLPELEAVQSAYAGEMAVKMGSLQAELARERGYHKQALNDVRRALIERQRAERITALKAIEIRQADEAGQRQSRFRRGLKGLWDFVRGEASRIKKQNRAEAALCKARDDAEKEALIKHQRHQRRLLAQRNRNFKDRYSERFRQLAEDRARYVRRAGPSHDLER